MPDTIFGQIARGEIAVERVHEDEICLGFADIAPVAPVHLLVIPRHPFSDAVEADAPTLGHCLSVAAQLGATFCPDGFRLVTNIGKQGGQSVEHLHIHVIGGRDLGWPPG